MTPSRLTRTGLVASASGAAGGLVALLLVTGAEWGTVPDWVEALATVVAAGAAIGAGRWALRLLEVEQRRDERLEEERRREQASHVGAYIDAARIVHIVNASKQPVHDLNVRVDIVGRKHPIEFPYTLGPSKEWPEELKDQARDDFNAALVADGAPPSRLEMAFTDGQGVRWRRELNGRLSEVFPGHSDWSP